MMDSEDMPLSAAATSTTVKAEPSNDANADENNLEDGEIDSDSNDAPYEPLTRPERHDVTRSSGAAAGAAAAAGDVDFLVGATRPRSATNSSTMANAGDTKERESELASNLSPRSQVSAI